MCKSALMCKSFEEELSTLQLHCYTCGKPLPNIRYRCPVCDELHCSEECRARHIEIMDKI